jgi:hypothetical protein
VAAACVLSNRNDVETNRALVGAMAERIDLSRSPDMALLVGIHRLLGHPGLCREARLDFDEHQCFAVHRDQVDLGAGRAKVARQDPIALPSEMSLGDPLASVPQRDSIEPLQRSQSEITQVRDPLHPTMQVNENPHRIKVSGFSHTRNRPTRPAPGVERPDLKDAGC